MVARFVGERSMSKKTKKDNEAGILPRFRQVQIQGLNESVMMISNYERETMNYLSGKALKMYRELKTPKEE
jgi:hypothetical protein